MLKLTDALSKLSGVRPESAKPAVGVSASARIACGTPSAFDFVARDFFKNYQRWSPQVVDLSPRGEVPIAVGLRARQVTRDRGIDSVSEFVIAEIDAQRRFALKGVSEPFAESYEFAAQDAQTDLTFRFELAEVELSMRPFVKLIRAALQDGAEQTVDNLKRLLEGGATPAT